MDASLPISVPALEVITGPFAASVEARTVAEGWRKVCVVAGPGTAKATGLPQRVAALRVDDARLWPTGDPHAPIEQVTALAETVREYSPDVIVSVGGGSTHDSVKGVATLLALGGKLTDHCLEFDPPDDLRHRPLPGSKIPIVTVPTTLAGSEANGAAGFTDLETGRKRVLADPSLAPRIVLVDPEVLDTTPTALFLGSAMNALNHCVEGLASRCRHIVAEALLTKAMRELATATDPVGVVDRARASRASAVAGAGLMGSWLGLAHAIGHVLGARYRVPHGWCHAVMAGSVIRFNEPAAAAEHGELMTALGSEGGSEGLARWMEGRAEAFGLPRRLAELDVPHEDLADIAEATRHDHDSFYNPRRTSTEDIRALLESAW